MLHALSPKSFDKEKTKDLKIAIVKTSYYVDLLNSLTNHCKSTLSQAGVLEENIKIVSAPGSWEVPLFAAQLAGSEEYDAVVCFGIIVKGETYHFDMIKDEVARGMMDVALATGVPIINEVLAVDSIELAEARASDNNKNKGIEAANAAIISALALEEIN